MGVVNLRENAASKIGLYRDARTYYIPLEYYDSGAGVYKYKKLTSFTDDYVILPLEETCSIKKVLDKWEATAVSGLTAATTSKRKSVEYKSKLLQRDIDTLTFDETYANKDGLLIVVGHLFGAPVSKQEVVLIFGQVQENESEIDSKEGRPEFMFKGAENQAAIVVSAAGDVVPPVISPAIVGTIALASMYKRVAL